MEYLLILMVIGGGVLYLLKKTAENQNTNDDNGKIEKITKETYHAKDYILTKAEMQFYDALCKATATTYLQIWPMMSLKELIYVRDEEGKKNSYKHFNKINRKHIDFTLVNPKSSKAILCIELDDKSHKKQNRIERDTYVDEVMKQAGIKLLHVPAGMEYDISKLESNIKECLP